MEVVAPLSPDFDFNASIYASAPSTPKLMGEYYFSAPPSPTQITELYREFDELLILNDTQRSNSLATVPFAWEEKPGVPKSFTKELFQGGEVIDNDFVFDVISGEVHRDSSTSAEELFQGGETKLNEIEYENERPQERGRDRRSNTHGLPSSRSRRTRSLPPFRGFEQQPPVPENMSTHPTLSTCTTLAASGSGKGSKKWSFMDLFLFRSASDGRAMDKDPFKKYSATFRKHDEDFRNSTLRSDRSGSGSGSKRRGRVSAHELHYNVNRAMSNDMKKKTFLPYKQGILGRLAFNPTVNALANGFGFSHNN